MLQMNVGNSHSRVITETQERKEKGNDLNTADVCPTCAMTPQRLSRSASMLTSTNPYNNLFDGIYHFFSAERLANGWAMHE